MKGKNVTINIMEFEIEKARNNLDLLKLNIKNFLLASYNSDTEAAKKTFNYMEQVVEKISKRKKFTIDFQAGGDLGWYSGLFMHLAQWLEAEDTLNELLIKQLDTLD